MKRIQAIKNIRKIFLLTAVFVCLLLASILVINTKTANNAEASESIIYIKTESDFELFLAAGQQNNLMSGGTEQLYSFTTGKTYVLCNDIFLTRKNYDSNSPRVWLCGFFDGIFDGRGHSIVGLEINSSKKWHSGIEKGIADNYGYALFSVVGQNGVIKNLNLIDANVSFENKEAALLVGTNAGTIENVKVQGKVKGQKWAGGINAVNFGTIKDSLAIAEIELIPYASFGGGGSAGYISAMNSEDVYTDTNEGGESKGLCVDRDNYTPAYSLNSNIFYYFDNQIAPNTQYGSNISYDSFSYQQNLSNVVNPSSNIYIPEMEIKDYFGVYWYLLFYKKSYEQDPLSPITPANMIQDINMYNVDILLWSESESQYYKSILAGMVSSGNFQATYNRNENNFFNREKIGLDFFGLKTAGSDSLPSQTLSLEGEGTKLTPYIVKNVADLLKVSEMENQSAESTNHYLLYDNIDLSKYTLSAPLITVLKGEFDGNGYSISNIMGSSLVGQINQTGKLLNLRVSGKVSGAYGLIAQTNNGLMTGVDVDLVISHAQGAGIVFNNNGTISYSTVRTNNNNYGGGAIADNIGENSVIDKARSLPIYFAENYHDVPFITNEAVHSSSLITNSLNINPNWNKGLATLTNCAWFNSEGTSSSTGPTIYSLVTIQDNTNSKLYHTTGWTYGTESGFAFKVGSAVDTPELVFYSDNKIYKEITFFTDAYTTKVTEKYANKAIVNNDYFIKILDMNSSEWQALTEVIKVDNGDGVDVKLYDETDGYAIGVTESRKITISAIEWLLKFKSSNDIKERVATISFDWKDSGGNDTVDISNAGIYSFSLQSEFVDIFGTFNNKGAEVVSELSFKLKDYTSNSNAIFNEKIGLPNYDEIIRKVSKQETPDVFLTDSVINEIGSYIFSATIIGNESKTTFHKQYDFELKKGIYDMTLEQLKCSIGGLNSSLDAPIFNGLVHNFPESLQFENTKPSTYNKDVEIQRLMLSDGSIVTEGLSFLRAGIYECTLTISSPRYESKTYQFQIFINKKDVSVDLDIDKDEITFGQPLPEYTVKKEGEIFNYPILVEHLTDYSVGYNVGSYYIKPKIVSNVVNNNYNITISNGKTFSVSKADLEIGVDAYENINEIFNGEFKSLIVKKDKIGFVEGDTQSDISSIQVTYTYGDESKNLPFSFKNAGNYIIKANISAGNNYNSVVVSATLVIAKRQVKLKVLNKEIVFGDDTPSFEIIDELSTGLNDVILAEITQAGININTNCIYDKNSTTGWVDFLSSDSLYYEIPIILDEANLVGDFSNIIVLANTNKNGFLRVNKKEYEPILVSDKIVYTGNEVILQFSENLTRNNVRWYSISMENGEEISIYAPRKVSLYDNAVRPMNNKYKMACSFLTNYKYKPLENVAVEFDIIQASLSITGLFLYNQTESNQPTSPINIDNTVEYIGYDWLVGLKEGALPLTDDIFSITISDGETTTDSALRYKNVGSYSNITIDIICVGEIKNYKDYHKVYENGINITPRHGEMNSYEITHYYEKRIITPKFEPIDGFYVSEDIPDILVMIEKYFVYEVPAGGGNPVFTTEFSPVSNIELPGRYMVKIESRDPNYKIGENNSKEAIIYVFPSLVNLELNLLPETREKVFESAYLKQTQAALPPLRINIMLGEGHNVDLDVNLMIDDSKGVFVGTYDIVGAKSINHALTDQLFVRCINFTVTGGANKVKINKRKISFSWEDIVPKEVPYKSEFLSNIPSQLRYTQGINSKVKLVQDDNDENINLLMFNTPDITYINVNGTPQNANTLTAETVFLLSVNLSDGVNFEFDTGIITNQEIKVTPRSLSYNIKNIYEINSGDNLPSITFNDIEITGSSSDLSIFEQEKPTLVVQLVSESYDANEEMEGEFSANVIISSYGGNGINVNYKFVKVNEGQKALIVSKKSFMDISVSDIEIEYRRDKILPVIDRANLPQDTVITYSEEPINVGQYNVSVKFTKKHYNSLTKSANVVIKKAHANVKINKELRVLFRTDYVFSNSNIVAKATYLYRTVEGNFKYNDGLILKYGKHEYDAFFVPTDNINFATINFKVPIESYIESKDIVFVGKDDEDTVASVINLDDVIISETDSYTISFSNIEGLPPLYARINNSIVPLLPNKEYTFTESANDVLVEVFTYDGEPIFSKVISVKLAKNDEPGIIDPTPVDPGQATQAGKKSNEKLGIIMGSVFGSLGFIGIIVAVVIIIVRKKKNYE